MIILFWPYSGEWIKNTLKLCRGYFPQISAFYNLQRYLDGLRLIILSSLQSYKAILRQNIVFISSTKGSLKKMSVSSFVVVSSLFHSWYTGSKLGLVYNMDDKWSSIKIITEMLMELEMNYTNKAIFLHYSLL